MSINSLTLEQIISNLKDSLAPWFGDIDDDPNLSAFIQGYANSAQFNANLLQYVSLQTRLATCTDGFLDLFANDFFGNKLRRHSAESDASYRKRIQSNLLAERVTRTGLYNALLNLTGRAPIMFEPWNALDSNWLNGGFFLNVNCLGGSSEQWAYVGFIIVFRPFQTENVLNALNVNEYGLNANNYLQVFNPPLVSDDDILDLIARFKAEGVKIYTYIVD
jgi:hypothetical protein